MKISGIIAEYNPFHNGHLYQIETLRTKHQADYVVVAMSGDFVQRGEPAVYDKYTRTQMALNAGADLVIEIPSVFATSSAEDFATCGVSLFHQSGIVDTLCFGSECGDVPPLESIATYLNSEPPNFQLALKKQLKEGLSYPLARHHALLDVAGEQKHLWDSILASPNNILGIEYIKAIKKLDSNIKPITIKREGHGYHDKNVTSAFASASALREQIAMGHHDALAMQMPPCVSLLTQQACPLFLDDLSSLLNYKLLELLHQEIDLSRYLDVSSDLADRIQNQALHFATISERIAQLKTKQYTYTRISRALLHILLEIIDEQLTAYRSSGYGNYLRILGFQKKATPLLTELKKRSELPLITKVATAKNQLTPLAHQQFSQDLFASHLYQSLLQQKKGVLPRNEYTHSILIK